MKKFTQSKEKKQFISVLWLPIVILFLLFFSGPLGEYILRLSSKNNISYILFTENIFNIAFWGIIIFCFIILGFYFYKMLGKESDFSSRSIESNINSHKVTKNCIKTCSFLIAISIPLLVLSFGSRYKADDTGFYKKEILKEEQILFEYEDVEAVDVFLEWVRSGKHNSGYETFVQLKTENGSIYTLTFSGFSKDYYYVDSFLFNLDEDIITIDKTYTENTEEIIGYYEQTDIFNKIYKTE